MIILDFCLFVCFFESFGFVFVLFFLLSGLSKTRLQGGTWDVTLQFEARGCRLRASGSGFVGQLNHLLGGGLPSSPACTVIFRCSVLTPVLFQHTSVECVSMCAREHTPFNIVPACLPALSTSVVMSLTCFDLSLFITVLSFSLLCVNVHVSLFTISIVQCKCMDETGMGRFPERVS